ncbi:Stk1 family PASTA domain-containing Ser/Thr kinase [Salipaludibacillus sp. LMS25]|jgi:serine/threonine-protein kinase|uniref:Stk1 family PASTA domain-containing Ser/Thr kinase n=1 Tax=Salipaludibacillus sp. LMS25 TaxID=2924031 RepID=UPI0020D19F38|nr:Stk1 family PASTA domain-containing Ser/Thr kinase [Salipaludibacillus sp. LMS25]UTR15147.1 Stk1 family PASTA domain-containing Ser/Thr kinase [Salipaludibacillus sp. LMS25]
MKENRRINDRYEIIRPIGGGGMADVYLAKDLILDRHVAVKMLKEQFSKDDEFIRRFRREAQSATSLSHPNIVSIFDVGEEEDLYYIVMEYVKGQTLKDYITQKGKVTVDGTIGILQQIISAVKNAHQNHIVHRDIKPHNILIDEDGTAKVTDFGIARAISEATITHTNSVLGSVHYLSPEQARGGQVTYKSDLYSLGVLAYEMLSGEVPFKGDTAVAVAIKHLQEPLPLLKEKDPSIPQSVENFVMKATAKDPLKRFSTTDEMLRDLTTVLDPERQFEAPRYIDEPDEDITKAIPLSSIQEVDNFEETKMHAAGEQETTAFKKEKQKVPGNNTQTNKKKKGLKFWVKLAILGVLFIIGLIVVAIYFIPSWLHVEEVEIPEDLIGMPYEEAYEVLSDLNLKVEQELRYDEEVETGHVISHRPGGGQLVKVETTVTVVVSEGNEPIEMDNFIGQSRSQAEGMLEGFSDVNVQFEETSDYSDDTVIEQDPSAGETVIPRETIVNLTVSERPAYVMSNLYNMTREEVNDMFSENDLITIEEDEDYHSTVEEGRVISQSPSRGTEIRERITASVVYSRGPEPLEVEEPISVSVPFRVEVPKNNNENSYRIRISVTDMDHRTPNQIIDEDISSDETFEIPMTVAPEESGYIILYVEDEEFSQSPYEYPYEELRQYQ